MKNYKLLFVILILAMCAVCLVGCAPEEPTNPQTYAKIKIDKNELVLNVGQTETITAQVTSQDAIVVWESSNPAICSVNNGVVKGLTSGEAVVSASYDGETVYCVVEVRTPQQTTTPEYNMTLNKYNVTLKNSETYTINATITNISGETVTDATYTYSSSNEQVATVNANGVVTANGVGYADITVKYVIGEDWVSNVVRVSVVENYAVSITPFAQTLYLNEELTLNYTITKDGQACSYPSENVMIYTSDNTVAVYENGKVKGLKVGYITLTVLLTDVNVKSTYSFAVIDPSAPAINLTVEPSVTIFIGSNREFSVDGVSWGTIEYVFEDDRFYIDEGVLYGPDEAATTTLTVKHLETRQTATVSVKCEEFTPRITTVDQFLALSSVKSGDVYLDADIDLSNAKWKKQIAYTGYGTLSLDVAYLVDDLKVNLDGRGHKITVRYDHEFDKSVQVAGTFLTVTATGSVKNLQLDFEAKYVGVDDNFSTGTAGYKVCAMTLVNRGTIADNYIDAKFYADEKVRRTCAIGYYGSTIERNIYNATVYKNAVEQSLTGNTSFGWERANGNIANNVSVGNYDASAENKYLDRDAFFDAWANQEILNQNTYTNWSVEDEKLYLCEREVSDNMRVVERFDPCITTAAQLMNISSATENCYLGADIDLSNETWSKNDSYTHGSMTLSVAYLIESLSVALDGRGHKITVRYDNEFTETIQIGGLFSHVYATASIKNLHLDFQATYNGEGGTNGTGTQAFKACALAFRSYGLVEDCFIDAQFNVTHTGSGSVRTCGIGYYGSRIERSIYKSATIKNGTASSAGYIGWEQAGGNTTNTVQIDSKLTAGQNKFTSMDDFFTAWANNQISNQTDYTNWSIDTTNKTIKLNNVQITW